MPGSLVSPVTPLTSLPGWLLVSVGLGLAMIAVLPLAGCHMVWQLGNREELKTDIKTLLGEHGVTVEPPRCSMIGTTRDAMCRFTLDDRDVERLVKGLNLETALQNVEVQRFVEYMESGDRQQGAGCIAHPVFRQ